MKSNIENYLRNIRKELSLNISNEFNLNQEQYESYKTFDFVNFFLIHKYILDENKKDMFIEIPEDEYRDNFFSSIFHSLVLIKLYQNYFNYENIKPELEKGNLIYTNSKKRVFEVISNYNDSLRVNYKFPKKNEIGIQPIQFTSWNFTKLNPNLVDNKNTAKNINEYKEFLTNNFNNDFPFITDFKNKSLVIADQRFFRESKLLPIRYTNGKGRISNDLPFFNYLIECCKDFKTAEKFLLNSNQIFDEIIIIGDSKYLNCFENILTNKWNNKFINIILIGTDKPNSQNDFIEWNWALDEVKIANNENPNLLPKIVLSNTNQYSKIIYFKNEIENIKNEIDVNLSFILKYINFYFRNLIIDTNLSKGIFQEYVDRLLHYLKSDEFEKEFKDQFYEKNIFSSEIIDKYSIKIMNYFSAISESFKQENFKWNYIKLQATEVRQLFLIVEKKNYDTIKLQLQNERINNIKLISDKRIDSEKLYLDKWLNDTSNIENKTLIIPYLNNFDLYKKLKSIKGNCEVLCYENLDEIFYDDIVNRYNNEEKNKLTAINRNLFFETEFTFENKIEKRDLDYIFNIDFNNKKFQENTNEFNDLPKEKVNYEIQFNDNSFEKFESTKGVFLIEKNELIKTNIGEVYEGATIRFYQNNNPNEFNKILKIFDTENLLNSFDLYSDSWKKTLESLSKKFNGIENLYTKLFTTDYKINFNTFRQYFDENSKTRFPRLKTLELIKNFCISNNLKEELIVLEFEKFHIYSKKDHSIRQQAGRILGNDLLDYIASNKTEISDSLKKIDIKILDKLTETIIEKTITNKTLLDDE